MHPDGLSIPPTAVHDQQMAMAQHAMKQNEQAMIQQRRGHAVSLAVGLASAGGSADIAAVLANAHKISHFLETGHVPKGE